MKLSDIPEKKFVIDFPDQTAIEVDPWQAQEKIDQLNSKRAVGDEELPSVFDNVRTALGLPSQADYDAASAEEKPKHFLTRNQCMAVQAALLEFLSQLDSSKKLRDLSQKFSGSTRA